MLNQITHILLDAARMGDSINEAIKLNKEHDCLYRGGPEHKFLSVAPYIFTFKQNTPFADWYMEHGWGNSWGIPFHSSYTLPELYKHFRKLLKVTTEENQEIWFRFYDPRVLRIFLPNSEALQIREFFGPVAFFTPEHEDKAVMLKYTQINGVLKTQEFTVSDFYQPKPKAKPQEIEQPAIDSHPMPSATDLESSTNLRETPPEKAAEKPVGKGAKWNMFD